MARADAHTRFKKQQALCPDTGERGDKEDNYLYYFGGFLIIILV